MCSRVMAWQDRQHVYLTWPSADWQTGPAFTRDSPGLTAEGDVLVWCRRHRQASRRWLTTLELVQVDKNGRRMRPFEAVDGSMPGSSTSP